MSTLIQAAAMPHVVRQFRRAEATFDAHAAVHGNVAARLQQRLDVLMIQPQRVLDLGCRSGYQLDTLRERYPDSFVVGCDPAPGQPVSPPRSWPDWLRRRPKPAPRIASDPHRLPFASGSFDLVVSNLLLPWCHSPHAVFAEAARVLSSGGAFMFTSAGPDTLREYRAVWSGIDGHLHGFGLIDMHDLGDALLGAGFAAPVLDRDEVRIDYPSIDALQEELQRVGAGNLALGRRAGLMSPAVRKSLRAGAVQAAQDPEARFVTTLELVQGHAWKGEDTRQRRGESGEQFVSFESLRESLTSRDGLG